MKNKTANTVYSQLLYGNNKHISAIIVNIIDICNYNCYYCYNKKPRTNKILDLHALIHFIDWFSNNINSNIILFILGGEPTLHPQLFDFCVFLRKKYKNINCRIVTNFSYDIKKILTLLEYGIQFNASWHSLSNDKRNTEFIKKIKNIPKKYFDNYQIEVVVMYEKLFYTESLYVFDKLYNLIPNNVTLTPVENNHLNGQQSELYSYNKKQNDEYYKRIENEVYIQQHLHNSLIYEYDTYSKVYVTQQIYFNEQLGSFKNYICYAGVDQIFINFNGDIAPCDDLYEIGVNIGNIYDNNFDKSKFHYRICPLKICPCPFFSKKQKIIHNIRFNKK